MRERASSNTEAAGGSQQAGENSDLISGLVPAEDRFDEGQAGRAGQGG